MTILRLGTYGLIDEALVLKARAEPRRNYLGASVLGLECDRQLWYEHHAPIKLDDPRLMRIFRMGDKVEDLVIEWLRLAGLTVWTEDEAGEQFGFVDGPIAGHADGVVMGLPESTKPHLLEVKSAKASRFKEFAEKGCRAVESKYYAQCQIYMLKLKLEHCLFVVVNKDTCELYIERMELDRHVAENFILRGKEIVASKEMPDRKWKNSSYYKCKFCSYRGTCWGL